MIMPTIMMSCAKFAELPESTFFSYVSFVLQIPNFCFFQRKSSLSYYWYNNICFPELQQGHQKELHQIHPHCHMLHSWWLFKWIPGAVTCSSHKGYKIQSIHAQSPCKFQIILVYNQSFNGKWLLLSLIHDYKGWCHFCSWFQSLYVVNSIEVQDW